MNWDSEMAMYSGTNMRRNSELSEHDTTGGESASDPITLRRRGLRVKGQQRSANRRQIYRIHMALIGVLYFRIAQRYGCSIFHRVWRAIPRIHLWLQQFRHCLSTLQVVSVTNPLIDLSLAIYIIYDTPLTIPGIASFSPNSRNIRTSPHALNRRAKVARKAPLQALW